MKAIIFILGVLFITNSTAQKFDCSSKIDAYKELLQARKMNESFDAWSEVRKNCPKENEAIYTDGIQILQYKIDNATTDEEKEKLVWDVMKLYDQWLELDATCVRLLELWLELDDTCVTLHDLW